MSLSSSLLVGPFKHAGSDLFALPSAIVNLPVMDSERRFEDVHVGLHPKANIMVVWGKQAAGPQPLFDDVSGIHPIGYSTLTSIRKKAKLTIVNAMLGNLDGHLWMAEGDHQKLLVKLDEWEERGQLQGKVTLSARMKIELDPRVQSMHQEDDGFCGSGLGPPRPAWWIYLRRGWFIETDLGTIHECSLAEGGRVLGGAYQEPA